MGNKGVPISRKELKRKAKKVFKAHYVLLVIACLVAVMYGTEFDFVRSNANNLYRLATGQGISFGEEYIQTGGTIAQGVSDTLNGADAGEVVSSTVEEESSVGRVLEDLINDDADSGKAHANEQLQEYKDQGLNKSVTGRQNGIFAAIANDISDIKISSFFEHYSVTAPEHERGLIIYDAVFQSEIPCRCKQTSEQRLCYGKYDLPVARGRCVESFL